MATIKTFSPIELKAKKVKRKNANGFYETTTEIYQDGKLKAIFPASQRQPRKGQKSIKLNGYIFSLKW